MKRNTCYIIAGICAVITAVFLVANINLASVSGVEQEKIHREREMSADNGHDSKGIESVNDNAEQVSAAKPVLSAVSMQGSYKAYVCEGDSQIVYIQDQRTDKVKKLSVEPHLATGIISLEWFDDKTMVVFSHVSPYMGCMSVYDISTLEPLLEKYCSEYSFGSTLESLIYTETAPGNLGKTKIRNYEDELVYQTRKKEQITNFAVNEKNSAIAIVVGRYLKDWETQEFRVELLEKIRGRYVKIKKQKVKLNHVDSIQWKGNKEVVVVHGSKKEIITR